MATKVKPSRINITGVPSAGEVPVYVDDNTFQWGAIPSVIDGLTSTSTTDALSANQGKVLNDKISDLFGLGKFLSLWDATTGLPTSFPLETPYTYSTGDYFLVGTVSSATPPVNYRPTGSSYTGTASSTTESDELEVGDVYIYDGSVWLLQSNHGKSVIFSNIAGDAMDNANLSGYLNMKAFYLSDTSDLVNAQAAYDWYVAGKNPIIVYGNTAFSLDTASASSLIFIGGYSETTMSNSRTVVYERHLDLNISGGTVTSISGLSDTTKDAVSVLDTQTNYSTPYTPQYDGSPATKKYVDNHGVPAVGTNGQVLTVVSGAAAWANAPAETVVSGDSGTTYTIKVSASAPGSGTPATTITFVTN